MKRRRKGKDMVVLTVSPDSMLLCCDPFFVYSKEQRVTMQNAKLLGSRGFLYPTCKLQREKPSFPNFDGEYVSA